MPLSNDLYALCNHLHYIGNSIIVQLWLVTHLKYSEQILVYIFLQTLIFLFFADFITLYSFLCS